MKGNCGRGQEEGRRLHWVRRRGLKGAEQRGVSSLIKQVTHLNPALEGSSPAAFPLIIWWELRVKEWGKTLDKHSDRTGAGERAYVLTGEERGSALVQDSLESRSQDAKLTHSQVKLAKYQVGQRTGQSHHKKFGTSATTVNESAPHTCVWMRAQLDIAVSLS